MDTRLATQVAASPDVGGPHLRGLCLLGRTQEVACSA